MFHEPNVDYTSGYPLRFRIHTPEFKLPSNSILLSFAFPQRYIFIIFCFKIELIMLLTYCINQTNEKFRMILEYSFFVVRKLLFSPIDNWAIHKCNVYM